MRRRRAVPGYCAWHSYGTCSGVPVRFGFFFDRAATRAATQAHRLRTGTQGLSALANERSRDQRAVTDPRSGGWWDASGAETPTSALDLQQLAVSVAGQQWKIRAFSNGVQRLIRLRRGGLHRSLSAPLHREEKRRLRAGGFVSDDIPPKWAQRADAHTSDP